MVTSITLKRTCCEDCRARTDFWCSEILLLPYDGVQCRERTSINKPDDRSSEKIRYRFQKFGPRKRFECESAVSAYRFTSKDLSVPTGRA